MFDRTPDPAVAHEWIDRLQQIFRYIRLIDAEKVACAINQFDKKKHCWWKVVSQAEVTELMTWTRFITLFYGKYLRDTRLDEKVRAFLDIRQDKMTVPKYTAKFDASARFAHFIVPTNKARKVKYLHGLQIDIVKQVDSGEVGPWSYTDVVQRALQFMDGRVVIKKQQSQSQKV